MSAEAMELWATLGLPDAMRTLAAAQSIRPSGDAATLAATESPRRDAPSDLSLELDALPAISLAEGGAAGGAELEVTARLGEGGMGIVDQARQRSLWRDVAVKRIRDRRANEPAVRALLAEARITGSLEHPNIIPIHALGRDAQGNPALVMKRVEGSRWAELVRDSEHPAWASLPADRLRWHLETLMRVCHAIELAHSRGVLHRDLKPDNVMIGSFGEVYVLDWGIALRLEGGIVEHASVAGTWRPRWSAAGRSMAAPTSTCSARSCTRS